MSIPQTVEWLERLFGHEGGLSLDPQDPGNWTGGRPGKGVLKGTKYGISAAAYPERDIASLTREHAALIYELDYLTPLRVERFHDGVGFQLFDYAVNAGVDGAIKGLQRALGVVADGKIGPVTLAALNALTETDVIMRVAAQRIRAYVRDPKWATYGAGWMNRMADNLDYGAEDS